MQRKVALCRGCYALQMVSSDFPFWRFVGQPEDDYSKQVSEDQAYAD